MSLDEVFLREILDRPEDDTPRLVYADWLEEHADERGRARAELIRVQCERERLQPEDPRRAALDRRARALLRSHGRRWTKPLREAKLGLKGWEFRRGFVEEIRMSASRFVSVAAKLFELAPVRAAYFPDASNEVNALAECPYLARLRSLDLHKMCVCGHCRIHLELRRLFASPHVANLTTLIVAGDRLDVQGARHLASSEHLGRLATLDLSHNHLNIGGAKALAAANLPALTTLLLADNSISPGGVQALAGSPLLGRLTTLDLAGNYARDRGAKALADSPRGSNLTRLDLRNNEIGPAGARALARSPHFNDRLVLLLGGNEIPRREADGLRDRFGDRVEL